MKKEIHLVLGMVLVMVAIVIIVRFPGRGGTQVASPAGAGDDTSAVAVPFTEVARGSNSTVTTRVNYAITSADQLSKLWKMVDATGTPPTVDFDTEAVIAVFAGQQPTTGYEISVAKIEDTGTRMVSITLAQPASDCMTGQALTAPYEIVVLPATSLPLAHEDVSVTTACTN